MRRMACLCLCCVLLAICPACTTTMKPITNPVFGEDFPDPFVLRVGKEYYAYATNAVGQNIQMLHSSGDLTQWTRAGDALPVLPKWAATSQSLTWAPSVLERTTSTGTRYLLYYTSRDFESRLQCIGIATADSPAGPFVDGAKSPFICQSDLGGSIDPSPFVDADGQVYLLWKNDGNARALKTSLWSAKLSPDGLALAGDPVELLYQNQTWEYPLIEGPSMLLHDGAYFLFYSANRYDSDQYAVGYALCQSAAGPCARAQDGPWLASQGNDMRGPGGQEFFSDPNGQIWMAFHAWALPHIGYPEGRRALYLTRLGFEQGKPLSLDVPAIKPKPGD